MTLARLARLLLLLTDFRACGLFGKHCSGASGADTLQPWPQAALGQGTAVGDVHLGPSWGCSVALDWVSASPSLHLGTQSRGPWLSLGSGSYPWPWEPRDIRSPVEAVHPAAIAARGPCWPAPPCFPGAHSRLLLTAVSSCDQEQQSALEEARQPKNDNVVIPECAHGGLYKPVQCHPSTGYCWCVLVDTGRPIPGTSTR